MPSRLRCFAVLCFLLGWSHLASAQDAVFSSGFELRGLNPRSGALVELRSSTEVLKAQTVADAQGSFAPFPAATIAAGDFLVAYGGEWQGIAPTGELRLLLDSPSAPQQLNAVTTLVTAVAASELVTGTTPVERLGNAVSYLTARALIDSDWRNGSPSRVVGPSAATLEAVGGVQNWAATLVADLADGDLAAEWLQIFPHAHGGVVALRSEDQIWLRGDIQTYTLDVVAILPTPSGGWAYSLQQGPSWVSLSSVGTLSVNVPSAVALGSSTLKIRVTNPTSGLFRDLDLGFQIAEGSVVASASYMTNGGELWLPDNTLGVRVAPNSFNQSTTVQWVRFTRTDGQSAHRLRTVPANQEFLQAPVLLQAISSQTAQARDISCSSDPIYPNDGWGSDWFLKDCYRAHFYDPPALSQQRLPNNTLTTLATELNDDVSYELASVLAAKCNTDCLGKTPVLFIHGYTGSGNLGSFGGGVGTWGDTTELLPANHVAYQLRFRTNARFQDMARDLHLAVTSIRQETGQKVHIVAHSFGGLLARTYLQNLIPVAPAVAPFSSCSSSRHPLVASLTTLGTPHSGVSDESIVLNGVRLPRGQHDFFGGLIEACDQISCYQAGETGVFDNPVERRFLGTFGVEANAGFIPVELSRFGSNPMSVPTQALIGMGHQGGSGNTFDRGDGLISYQGQRFAPGLACPGSACADTPVASTAITSIGNQSVNLGHCVYERILGSVDPSAPPIPGAARREQSMIQFYRHSSSVSLGSPIEPLVSGDEHFFDPDTSFGPKHDLINRLRDWLARTDPDPATRSIRVAAIGAGAVEVDNAGVISRCEGTTSTPGNCTYTVGMNIRIRVTAPLISISPRPCANMSSWCDWKVGPFEQVTAFFNSTGTQSVRVNVTGAGQVTITPGARVCRPGTPCQYNRLASEVQTLVASSTGGNFAGWSGSHCAGSSATTCTVPTVTLTTIPVNITANFTAAPPVTSRRLNDTGQNWCANNTTGNLSCPQSGFPDQDGDHGRDAQARAGTLVKIGGGEAGFDYTKISNSGNPLPASAVLGTGPNDWGCTRDNVTGLIWEVKTNNPTSLRHMNHTYTWYSTDASVNGGNPGSLGTATTCNSTLPQCNTQAYVAAVNAQGLCGANNWRMPTPQELQGIVHYGRSNPAIDPVYFVNTATNGNSWLVWTGRTSAFNASSAWNVDFGEGYINIPVKSNGFGVRLVRAGQ